MEVFFMSSEAMQLIASGYVRLKDRTALERMREHRNRLLQDYRSRVGQSFRVEIVETSLQGDIDALDEALSRLST